MSRILLGTLTKTIAVLAIVGLATPALAGHDLRREVQDLERQTCALASTIKQGYRSASSYQCLLIESSRLEALVQQAGCMVVDPHRVGKAEHLLRHAESQAETICNLLSDVEDHCVPRSARKRAHQLIECIEDDIDDLADAIADCDDHHRYHGRPVLGNVPRQGGWGLWIQR